MSTLAISCLTTSNLHWFMDLTFQVPMQYCSLQHQTLLPSPVTSTTGYCFHLGWCLFILSRVISPLFSSSILGTCRPGELIFQYQKDVRTPREFDFGGQWDLITELTWVGKTDSWRAQTKRYVHQVPGERSSDPTRDWPRLVCECLESLAEVWVSGGLLQVRGTECSSACMGPFEGSCHYLHYLHHSLVSGQTIGREHSPTHQQQQQNLLNMAPPIRTRPSFPHSQCLPSGSSHKPLILHHQRTN